MGVPANKIHLGRIDDNADVEDAWNVSEECHCEKKKEMDIDSISGVNHTFSSLHQLE